MTLSQTVCMTNAYTDGNSSNVHVEIWLCGYQSYPTNFLGDINLKNNKTRKFQNPIIVLTLHPLKTGLSLSTLRVDSQIENLFSD
jgi:hypothetical protein